MHRRHCALQRADSPAIACISEDELQQLRRNHNLDWAGRESVRAKMRLLVKRILDRHGYPPDRQNQATQTALEQTELPSASWAA